VDSSFELSHLSKFRLYHWYIQLIWLDLIVSYDLFAIFYKEGFLLKFCPNPPSYVSIKNWIILALST